MKDKVVPVFISEAKEEMKECPLHPKVCWRYLSLYFTKGVIQARLKRDSGAITERKFTAILARVQPDSGAISARFKRNSSAIQARFQRDSNAISPK